MMCGDLNLKWNDMKTNPLLVLGTTKLRHKYFAIRMIEEFPDTLVILKDFKQQTVFIKNEHTDIIQSHINEFKEVEKKFFSNYVKKNHNILEKHTVKIIENNINDNDNIELIKELNPNLIIVHTMDLIKDKLIDLFPKRILNLHAGLSPYYRGMGTNVFPFYNNELEYVGMTIHYIDKGIDSGEIILQGRPTFEMDDNTHTIGCKNVILGANLMIKTVKRYISEDESIPSLKQDKGKGNLYLGTDFSENIIIKIRENLHNNIVSNYVNNPKEIDIVRW